MNKKAIKTTLLLALTAIIAGGTACQRRNEAKERIEQQRTNWYASLPDSLEAVKRATDSIRNEIVTLGEQVDKLLPYFNYIDNPREVEGYYISKDWASSYPLKTTGLVMRLTKGEKAELIAALAGGAHFNRIRVTAGGMTAESGIVPHDQALNYRMDNLNTVCFSDSASDSCAKLIADNAGSEITIYYLNGDSQTGKLKYPAKSQATLAKTWQLYDLRRRTTHGERMLPVLAKKASIISEKLERIEYDHR